uniref:Uncharacterized protein n=1 Tax=Rhizophora mucronata TaxID=61149 RepID=A0A2P2R1J2_RHIMU
MTVSSCSTTPLWSLGRLCLISQLRKQPPCITPTCRLC